MHGDYRLDNTVLHPTAPGRILAVLDWEMSTLGDPLTDLGALLASGVSRTTTRSLAAARIMAPVTAAEGFPTRAEVVERYAARTGFDVSDVDWYQAFAFFKLAVICQGIAARGRGRRDARLGLRGGAAARRPARRGGPARADPVAPG